MSDGLTGEWIIRVQCLAGPEDASAVWDKIGVAVHGILPGREVEVIFDASRWKGGDF